MRRFDDHLLLSPSDLNDLLECRHLMALEIAAVPRASRCRSRTRGAHTEILVRYGEQHEQRECWRSWRREGVPVVRIETGRRPGPAARGAVEQTRAAMRRRRRGDPPGGAGRRRRRRLRRLPGAGRAALAAGRVELRGGGRQAGPDHQDLLPRPALGLRGDARASCRGWPPEELAVLLGDGTPRHVPHRRLRRLRARAARPRRADWSTHGARRHLPAALQPLRDLRLPPRLRAAARSTTTTCRWSPASAATRRVKLEEAGVPTLTGAGRAARERPRCRGWPATRWPSCGARRRCSCTSGVTGAAALRAAALRGTARLRAAAAEPAVGDLIFDIEGDPYIGDKGLEYLFGVGWLDDDGGVEYRRVLGARPRPGAALVRGADRLLHRLAGGAPGQPHLPLRRLRGAGAEDAGHVPRAPARTRSTTCCAIGALVDLFRVVRQGVRISKPSYSLKQVEHFYRFEREAKVKEAGGSIVAYERWLIERRPGGARRDRGLQPRGRAPPRAACATGCCELREELIETGAEVTWRPRPGGARGAARADGRGDPGAARAAAGDRRSGERRCSASCCSTTAARPSRAGGGTSSG